MEGIDLFVKILVFVKILSQWRRKEGILRSGRGKLIVLKNDDEDHCFLKYFGFRRQNRVLQHAVAAKMKKFAEQ